MIKYHINKIYMEYMDVNRSVQVQEQPCGCREGYWRVFISNDIIT